MARDPASSPSVEEALRTAAARFALLADVLELQALGIERADQPVGPEGSRALAETYYGRTVRPVDRRTPLTWASVPRDYDTQIRALRRARGLSQAQLATLVGAARKAVVYQWEARKRTPSPVFWQRITALHR